MCRRDVSTAVNHHWDGCSRNDDDPFPSVSFISVRETDAEVHTISREGASFGGVWSSCNLLPEKCQPVDRKPWNTGGGFHSSGDHAAFMEEADAAFHSGRNRMLYASGAVCFLNKIMMNNFNELWKKCSVFCNKKVYTKYIRKEIIPCRHK